MNTINLLPLQRTLRKHARRTRRAWLHALAVALAVCSVTIGGLGWSRWNRGQKALDNSDLVAARIDHLTQRQADLRQQKQHLVAQQSVERFVTDRPDWSKLFSLLDQSVGEEVVLRRIHLEPVAYQDDVPSAYRLPIAGLAASQADVSGMALAMEDSGVFSRIQINTIQQQAIQDKKHVSFELTAYLGDAPIGATP